MSSTETPKNNQSPHSLSSPILVGVITSRNKTDFYPQTKLSRLYREMVLWGRKKNIIIFLFYPENILWQQKKIKGITLSKNNRWITQYFSFPHIIYNRLPYRSDEKKIYVQKIFEKMQKNNIFLFNTRFLNKWETYQALKDDLRIISYLPASSIFSKSSLYQFVNSYPEVFLKPQNNSRGQGIIKIISNYDRKQFIFACADVKPLRWIKCTSFQDLYLKLLKYVSQPKYYLLQQGIELAQFKGRIFDLRTQVQKNGEGEWTLTGIGVRIAAPERFVTHIPNGGKAASFEDVINHVFGKEKNRYLVNKIKEDLTLICKIVPQVLEKNLKINLAILSLDIGIDKNGNLYIFEVNSKPASFDEEEIRKRHLELLTDYFIFAANSKK